MRAVIFEPLPFYWWGRAVLLTMTTARWRLACCSVVAAAWLGAVSGGFVLANVYSARPGTSAEAPSRWPAQSRIARHEGRTTVVLFVHPLCPCTRATLRELQRILARGTTAIDVAVVLAGSPLQPSVSGTDEAVVTGVLPSAKVLVSEAEARVFSAATSGQVVAYDEHGALVFAGGITSARGHEGPSRGGDDLLRIARGERPMRSQARVFGCALEGPKARNRREH